MTQPLRVATIGAGYFAAFHHEAWRRHPETDLVAVIDQDLAKAKATGAPAFARLAELGAAPLDIIDIATPPATHAALIHEALALAPKAIICQKPFAQSIAEGEALADAAAAASIPLLIHENFRFQPWYRKAREVIDQGSLGTLHQVSFRLRTGDGQGPEAYLSRQPYFQTMPRFLIHETAVHWVDTFRYLLGPIEGVYADLRRLNPVIAGEDAGHVIFTFAQGLRAVFDGNRHLDHVTENPRLTFGEALIEGTRGTLRLSGDGGLALRCFGATHETHVLPPAPYPGFAGDCVYALQAHVVEALNGRGAFENEARDYLTVRHVEDAIYASHADKRWTKI